MTDKVLGGPAQPVYVTNEAITQAAAARGTLTNRSGTIAQASVSQVIMGNNPYRRYLLFQNISDADMWIDFGTSAVAAQPSIKILPGGTFVMEDNFVTTEAMNVFCASADKAYTAKEG